MPKNSRPAPILQDIFDAHYRFPEPKDDYEKWANDALDAFDAEPNFSRKAALLHKWKAAVSRAIYKSDNAKEIPLVDLRVMISLGADPWLGDVVQKYANKVRSPLTAIRAFCVMEQGGTAGVRNCTMVGCVLYPFRMGSNPFRGRIADADVEAVEEMQDAIETADQPLVTATKENMSDADQETVKPTRRRLKRA